MIYLIYPVSLWHLSLKAMFLVAITSDRRVSKLAALGFEEPFLTFFPDEVVLRLMLVFVPKVASRFHITQEVTLPMFRAENSQEPIPLDFGHSLKTYSMWTL